MFPCLEIVIRLQVSLTTRQYLQAGIDYFHFDPEGQQIPGDLENTNRGLRKVFKFKSRGVRDLHFLTNYTSLTLLEKGK